MGKQYEESDNYKKIIALAKNKKIAVKSHQTKRMGHMCKKIAEISRQKKKEGHRSKEKMYMSQQYRWAGHKDKENIRKNKS